MALSDAQIKAFQSGVLYFDTESNGDGTGLCGSTVAGDYPGSGPIFGPYFPKVADINDLINRIKTTIEQLEPNSTLDQFAKEFVMYGQQYNVNPALLVGVGQADSQLGTTPFGPPPKYNFWNERGGNDGTGFETFSGYPAAIQEYYKNLRTNSAYASVWAKGDAATIDDIINIATPPSDGNDTSGYIQTVKEVMHKILDGIALADGSSSQSPPTTFPQGSTTASQCQGSSNYQAGANGYDLSGTNAMAHFYQCDPKWASHPYGKGKSSICEGGCGITSLAMVIDTLAGVSETPQTLADKYGDQYHGPDGTEWSLWAVAAKDYGLNEQDIGVDLDKAASIIRQGGLVIISVNAGYFTSDSHLMVLRAVDDQGNFYLADPNGPNNPRNDENKPFSQDFLRTQGSLTHLFAFTK